MFAKLYDNHKNYFLILIIWCPKDIHIENILKLFLWERIKKRANFLVFYIFHKSSIKIYLK